MGKVWRKSECRFYLRGITLNWRARWKKGVSEDFTFTIQITLKNGLLWRSDFSLRKPNTNSQKLNHVLTISPFLILPHLLLPPTPSPYAMTAKHGQQKNHSLPVSPFLIRPQLLLPPRFPLMQCWYGKWCLPGNCSWPRKQHWVEGWGWGRRQMWWFACLPVNALGWLILLSILSMPD